MSKNFLSKPITIKGRYSIDNSKFSKLKFRVIDFLEDPADYPELYPDTRKEIVISELEYEFHYWNSKIIEGIHILLNLKYNLTFNNLMQLTCMNTYSKDMLKLICEDDYITIDELNFHNYICYQVFSNKFLEFIYI